MKKRIISLLLTLVMLMSLCAGLGTSASADAGTKTATLQKGDTVLKLCERNGVDFYANKQRIMSLNGLTSEGQFNKLPVGTQIVLPDPNAAATTAAATTPTATAATMTAAAPTTSLTTASAQALPAGDYVSYYLVSYTVQPGQTIGGIYTNWGLSYKTYDNQIKKLNGITSYNSIAANKSLLLPTTNPALANSAYYTVMAHVMKSGESAYNIVCDNYKLNYLANQKMLMALNNTSSLDNIQAGSTLYIPVAGLVTASSVVSTSTAATTTTATISTSASYNLVSQTSANGSFDLQVEGQSVSCARAGSIVRVVATPDMGYTLDTIRVVKVGDASTVVGVSGTSFTMPSYSVIVSVTFKAAKYREISAPSAANGSAAAMVNGVKVSGAYVGNTVYVKTIPATGFMLDNVRVTYNNGRDSVAVYNNVFTMPDTDVSIDATFKKDPDYDPARGHAIYCDANFGSIRTFLGNSEVSNAKAGDRVTVEVTPDMNYTVQSVTVYYDNFKKTADIDKNSFTMPDAPVTIIATIKPTASATFEMTKVTTTDGTFDLLVDGKSINSAKIGANVIIKGTPKSAAFYYLCTVTKTGDPSVSVPVIYNEKDGTSSFVMPDHPVSVRVKFYRYHKIILDASNGTYGNFAVYAKINNALVNTCAEGVELGVNVWGVKNGYTASNVILTYADGSTYTLENASFIMPDCDVKVKVNFAATQTVTAHAITVKGEYGKFGNTYTVGGKTLNGNKAATVDFTAGIGSNIIVTPNAAFGYEVESIFCNYTDKLGVLQTILVGKNPITDKYQFEMPELKAGTKLDLYVTFREIVTYPISLDYSPNNLSHEKGTFNVTTINNSAFVDHAVYGAKLMLRVYPASGYTVDLANVKVINQNTGALVEVNKNDYTFIMPQAPVVISVPFNETSFRIRLERANNGIDGQSKGHLSAIINGIEYTDDQLIYLSEDGGNNYVGYKFEAGTLVTIVNSSRSGYVLNSEQPIVVKKMKDGQYINYKTLSGDHFSFDMPNSDVTVSAQYVDDMIAVNAVPAINGTYSVPKQVAWNGELTITDIHPADGYQLDKILLTYVGHDGTTHIQEELNGTRLNLGTESGMLKSDITVEVLFKPALNPLMIHYVFDDTPDTSGSSNYKVRLLADGTDISARLDRGTFGEGNAYDDVLEKAKVGEDGKNYDTGLKTGATVIISRDDFKADKNFNIVNIYIMYYNGTEQVAIKPEFANGQYYFNVPYVPTGLAKDLVINIQYAKDIPDTFALTAIKAAGNGGNAAKAVFKADDAEIGKGTIDKEITLTLIADPYSKIAASTEEEPTAWAVYTDSYGVAHRDVLECEEGENVTLKLPALSSVPMSKSVTVEYTSKAKVYAVEAPETEAFTISPAEEGKALTDIPWGDIVRFKVAMKEDSGKAITKLMICYKLNGEEVKEELLNDNGVYSFVMPMTDDESGTINVIAEYVAVEYHMVSYTPPEGTESNDYTGKVIITANGIDYENKVSLAPGTKFTVRPYIIDGKYENLSCDSLTIGEDGAYTMGEEDVTISVTFTPAHPGGYELALTIVPESISIDDAKLVYEYFDMNGSPKTPAEGKVSLGDIVRVHAESKSLFEEDGSALRCYTLKTLNIAYETIDGTWTDSNASEVTYYADGSASFRVKAIPKDKIVGTMIFTKNAKYPFTVKTEYSGPNAKIIATPDTARAVSAANTVNTAIEVRYCYSYTENDITVQYLNTETGAMTDVPFKLTPQSKISDNKTYVKYNLSFVMPAGDTLIKLKEPAELVKEFTVSASGCECRNGDGEAATKFALEDDITLHFDLKKDADENPTEEARVSVTFNTEETKSFTWDNEGNTIEPDKTIKMSDIWSAVGLSSEQVTIPLGGKITVKVTKSPITATN